MRAGPESAAKGKLTMGLVIRVKALVWDLNSEMILVPKKSSVFNPLTH
jgi:hypothetical protein